MIWIFLAGVCTFFALVCACWPRRPLVGAFFCWSFAGGCFLTLWHWGIS